MLCCVIGFEVTSVTHPYGFWGLACEVLLHVSLNILLQFQLQGFFCSTRKEYRLAKGNEALKYT